MSLGLVLYQPEIAENLGAAIRNAACFDARLDIIEPCGFPWKTKEIERVAMDYRAMVKPIRHADWQDFLDATPNRLVLLSTKGELPHHDFSFQQGDRLILGQESQGAPDHVHARAQEIVRIPLAAGARSLNVATAGAIVLAEARRQLGY